MYMDRVRAKLAMATPSTDEPIEISMGGGKKESCTTAEIKTRELGRPVGFFPPPDAYPAYPPPQARHGCPPPPHAGHGHGCPPPACPSYCPPHGYGHGGYPCSYGCPPPSTYPHYCGGYHGHGGYCLVPGGYYQYHRPPPCYHHHYSGKFRRHRGHYGGEHTRFYEGFMHGRNKWK